MSSYQIEEITSERKRRKENSSINSGSIAFVESWVKPKKIKYKGCPICGHRNPLSVNHCYACGAFLVLINK